MSGEKLVGFRKKLEEIVGNQLENKYNLSDSLVSEKKRGKISRRDFLKGAFSSVAAIGAAAMIPSVSGFDITSDEGFSYFDQGSSDSDFSITSSGGVNTDAIGSKSSRVSSIYADKVDMNSRVIRGRHVEAIGGSNKHAETFNVDELGFVSAFENALSAVSSGGAVVLGYAPESDPYKINSDFGGFEIPEDVSIVGRGKRSSVIKIEADQNSPILDLGGASSSRRFGGELRNFSIEGKTDESIRAPEAVDMSYCSGVSTYNIRVHKLQCTAFNLDHSWDTVHIDSKLTHVGDNENNKPAISLDGAGEVGSGEEQNNAHFIGSHVERPKYRGITIKGGSNRFTSVKLHGEDQQSNHPLVVIENTEAESPSKNKFVNCDFESINNGGGVIVNDCESLIFNSCGFENGASPPFHLKINGGRAINVSNCDFGVASKQKVTDECIHVAGGDQVTIDNCNIDGFQSNNTDANTLIRLNNQSNITNCSLENSSNAGIVLGAGSAGSMVKNIQENNILNQTILCNAETNITVKNVASISYGGNAVSGRIEDVRDHSATASANIHLVYNEPTDLSSQPSRNNITGWGINDGTNGTWGPAVLKPSSNSWRTIEDSRNI